MTTHATGDRHHRRDHRSARPRQVTPAVGPRGVNPKRLLDGGYTAFAHAHPGHARIGREPVDVGEVEVEDEEIGRPERQLLQRR